MPSADNGQRRIIFGPFELDTLSGELSKSGLRIRLPGQPGQILLTLLAQPGQLVTREQLKQQVWRDQTFVDFEHGIYAAMNKLRRALNDSADSPRYIETVPGRGYRFIGTVERQGDSIPSPLIATAATVVATAAAEPVPHRNFPRWAAAGGLCATVALALALAWISRGPTAEPPWKFTRLTAGGGLADTPALSPDGSLVAYSSDSGPNGERDLYIKRVDGGQPIRLTLDGAGNTTPDFSPDGNRIVFRSNQHGGGIYEVPAFGGEIRLVAQGGLNPRFSPDGSQVAYWRGAESVTAAVPGTGSAWVVPLVGGESHQVGQQLTATRYPIWAPDGKHLLVVGYSSQRGFDNSALDWWLVSANGNETVQTGAHAAIIRAGMELQPNWRTPVPVIPPPSCWSGENTVVFSTVISESRNLWEVTLSRQTGKVSSLPKRLTTSSANDVNPSCSNRGALAFANVETKSNIWLLPFDLNAGKAGGMLEQMNERPGWRETASLAGDGRTLAFASFQSGESENQSIWLRDLQTGKETGLAGSQFAERYPVSNRSGDRVAYSVYEKEKRVVYIASLGGTPQRVCEGCLRATDWSLDEKELIVFGGVPYQIKGVEIASGRQIPLIQHAKHSVLYGRLSTDNRWISFTARVQPSRGRITIASTDGPKPVPENAWIVIADAGADDYASWSPDGRTLYFTSDTDGYSCLWGQRLDAISKRPMGQAFAVLHLHGRLVFGHGGWSAAGGRIAMALSEKTGNIWMMSRSGRR